MQLNAQITVNLVRVTYENLYRKTLINVECRCICSGLTKSNTYISSEHFLVLRNIYQRCSIRIGVLRNFFFLLKKRLGHRCFPVNYAKFLRTFLDGRFWFCDYFFYFFFLKVFIAVNSNPSEKNL